MQIKIYSKFNEELRDIWTNFEKQATMTPFQSYAWLFNWNKMVGSPLFDIQLQIIHLKNDNLTFAILPLCIRKYFGIRILEWLGGVNTDYMGHLGFSNDCDNLYDENIWDEIEKNLINYDVINFEKQPQETLYFLNKIGFPYTHSCDLDTYKTDLPTSWNEYKDRISNKRRSNIRYYQRQINKLGQVKLVIAKDKEEKHSIIDTMITQKRKRYQESKTWDMLALKEYQQFYHRLADIKSDIMQINCAELKVEDLTIAAHVGIVDDSTFYYLMPSHESSDFKKYSPGILLLVELLKWSIENNLKYFDFTIGGDIYKKTWCNQEISLYHATFSKNIVGNIYLIVIKIRERLKTQQWLKEIVSIIKNSFNKS